MVIAFEGLPGAGKTTAAATLSQRLKSSLLLEETAKHPFLDQIYRDADRDDLTIELAFLLVHANPLRRAGRDAVVVTDFAPAKDLLFARLALEDADLTVFETVFDRLFPTGTEPDVVIYLRATPELCLARVTQRLQEDSGRVYEQGLTLQRLRRLHETYEGAIGGFGRTVISWNVDPLQSPVAAAEAFFERLQPHLDAMRDAQDERGIA